MENKQQKLITEADLDTNKRQLARKIMKGVALLLSTSSVAKAEHFKGLVKAAVHKRVHDLPDTIVKHGLTESDNSSAGRVKRWTAQAVEQVQKWYKTKK